MKVNKNLRIRIETKRNTIGTVDSHDFFVTFVVEAKFRLMKGFKYPCKVSNTLLSNSDTFQQNASKKSTDKTMYRISESYERLLDQWQYCERSNIIRNRYFVLQASPYQILENEVVRHSEAYEGCILQITKSMHLLKSWSWTK